MFRISDVVRTAAFGIVVALVFVASVASAAIVSHTTGSSNKPIVSGVNTGNGIGVQGSSVKNMGVQGLSQAVSDTKTQYAAVEGEDNAPAANAQYNDAIRGFTAGGTGVEGDTQANHPDFGVSGVYGGDTSTYHPNGNSGVEGYSKNGIGVLGIAATLNKDDPQAAVFGYASSSASANGNVGLVGYSNYGFGLSAQSNANAAAVFYSHSPTMPVITLTNNGGGPIFSAMSGPTHVASLDHSGNLVLAGTLTENGSPAVVVASSANVRHVAYAPAQPEPSMEDVGEGQLRYGYARVPLDPDFASTIDRSRPYLVFITPAGMTTGTLCVVERDRSGFTVRENMNGRSSVAFDYRIVAHPYGSGARRLPAYVAPAAPHVQEFRIRVPHGKAPFAP